MLSTIVTVPANNGKFIIKDLLKRFVSFNFRKKFCRGTIRVSQVETMIKKNESTTIRANLESILGN